MQRPTKRQRLKRALACQRLGLESRTARCLRWSGAYRAGTLRPKALPSLSRLSQISAALRHASFQSLTVRYVSLSHRSRPHYAQIVEQSLC